VQTDINGCRIKNWKKRSKNRTGTSPLRCRRKKKKDEEEEEEEEGLHAV
jgi:hypothetical protein